MDVGVAVVWTWVWLWFVFGLITYLVEAPGLHHLTSLLTVELV